MIDLSQLIDDYLQRDARKHEVGIYHPSTLNYCMRQQYYSYKVERPWPKEKLRIFESGRVSHDFIREVLSSSKKGRLLAWEREFSILVEDLEIRGRLDDLIAARIGDEEVPFLIEVKTIGSPFSFERLTAPHEDHVLQIQPYLRISGATGLIWYIQRSTYEDRVFTCFYDEKLFEKLVARARELHGYLKREVPPPAEAKSAEGRGWECKFCLWSDECAEEGW